MYHDEKIPLMNHQLYVTNFMCVYVCFSLFFCQVLENEKVTLGDLTTKLVITNQVRFMFITLYLRNNMHILF